MRIVDIHEMRQIEGTVINDYGFSKELIIENVGIAGANFIHEYLQRDKRHYEEMIILVGQGNNGADGLSIGRHLTNLGHRVRAFVLFPDDPCTEELKKQIYLAKNYDVRMTDIREVEQLSSYFSQAQENYLIIDAIVGTGIRLPLSQYLFDVINLANDQASVMFAVDIASGIQGDTGMLSSTSIMADFTLAISYPKLGTYLCSGPQYSGETIILDVGFPKKLMQGGEKFLLTQDYLKKILYPRNLFFHKKDYGHLLTVGGALGMTGALALASSAAMHTGVGLVSAATWQSSYHELASRLPSEIMLGAIPPEGEKHGQSLLHELERFNSITIGPGLGRSHEARNLVLDILNHFYGPVLIDADGIMVLDIKKDAELLQLRKGLTVLTPHVGEFAHFMNVSAEEILKSPLEYLKEAVDKTGAVIILKSPCTILALPTGEYYFNYLPNDGLSKAGSGDVLAGIIGSLLSQTSPLKEIGKLYYENGKLYEAIILGLGLHTLAGEIASSNQNSRSMTAGDIIKSLSLAFDLLEEKQREDL